MLQSFRVENYKCFEDLTLEGLGRVNLITGANNVGKTAMLEALYLGSANNLVEGITTILRARKQLSSNLIEEAAVRELLFDEAKPITINGPLVTPHLAGAKFQLSRRIRDKDEALTVDPDFQVADPHKAIFKDALAIWQEGLDPKVREKYWDHLQLEGEQERILHFLQIIEPSIERVGLLNDGSSIRQPYYYSGRKQHRMSRLGAGMDRLLAIGFGLSFSQGNLLMIDEFEIGFHYSIIERVWSAVFETAKKLNVQVFATTHSLDCVRAFAKVADDVPEDGKFFRLDRRFGKIRAVSIEESDLRLATEEGLEVR